MLKILEVVEHGKYSNTDKLVGETIKCPECKSVGLWITNYFSVETEESANRFFIVCKGCKCKFRVEVE